MNWLFAVAAVAAGAATAFQAGMNVQLRTSLGSSLIATVVNFLVGLGFLGLAMLAVRTPLPSGAAMSSVPWWAWGSGVMGCLFVVTVALTGRELGAVALFGYILVGQLVAAVIIDHYALVGLPLREFSTQRLFGCALILFGAYLAERG